MHRTFKNVAIAAGLLMTLLLGGTLSLFAHVGNTTVFAPAPFSQFPLIIDPGHGGEDGGAVSADGIVESGINLAIALRLDAILSLYGIDAAMTRTEDISIHDETAKTLRQKKVSDLHNRVAKIQSIPNVTLMSIHQNKFELSDYHGAQVFYANGSVSLPFATLTQETLRQALDGDNHRQPTAIPGNVYLMNHINCRAILVECGFLSNAEEANRLNTSSYQTKLATALAASYLNFTQIKEGE